MKRLLILFLTVTLTLGAFPVSSLAAPDWPANVAIEADGGIVIDADSGAVLFGKNLHETYYPASITKVLTALIVLEECSLDEEVTFSHDAVYNVEAGSSNAGLDEGDVLTVEDCLYALLLQSANEAANALAEHVSGSREAFAELMNQRAAELGCQDSHFANPSGLNDENHWTSAYDMALICREAIQNPTFLEIDGTKTYKLPPTKRNPDGLTLYAHHAMLLSSRSEYYEGAFGGKTGYTSLAGNTLVTFASKNDMTLITVVLNGHQTHYSDTKAMLDFGFSNFHTTPISDLDHQFASLNGDMTIVGLPAGDLSDLSLEEGMITLPLSSSIEDTVRTVSYDLDSRAPENAIAQVQYTYNDRLVGSAYLLNNLGAEPEIILPPLEDPSQDAAGESGTQETSSGAEDSSQASSETSAKTDETPAENSGGIPGIVWIAVALAAAGGASAAAVIVLRIRRQKKEEERRRRQERRRQRLREIGVSDEEFQQMMAQRRSAHPGRPHGRSKKNRR